MATTTLTNGTKIPERASRDWYSDLSTNWYLLDNHLGDTDSHLADGLAPKATADASGNTITSTYATKTELSTLSTTVGTKANDADVVHKADAETITGAKTFSDTVTSADVVPSATDTYSLGSASYQYNAVYGKSYYYNGTQWGLDQANTWTETNTFTSPFVMQESSSNTHGYVIKASFARGTAPSANTNLTFRWQDSNGVILGFLDYIATSSMYAATLNVRTENNGTQVSGSVQLETDLTGSYFNFRPLSNDNINLGTSSYKWATLNGINPGALSLPNLSSYSIITSDFIANLDKTQTTFSWTSSYTGWLSVLWLTRGGTEPYRINVWAGSAPGSTENILSSSLWGQCFSNASYGWYTPTYFPVVAGVTYYFERSWVRTTNDDTTYAIVHRAVFIPALGNV